jgi:uncharacterized membrane protein YsdA (DUF1294 family)
VDGINRAGIFNPQLPGHESVLTSRTLTVSTRTDLFMAQRRLRHKCSKGRYQFVFWLIVLVGNCWRRC